jgi:excisionase family DNA binding protein
MEEYITIAEAARRIGLSDKTIRRAIHAGKLTARYPQPNRAEVSLQALHTWHSSLHVRPGETQDRLVALEARVGQLESEVQALREQLVGKKAPSNPKLDTALPDGFVWLSDFADLHYVPRNEAQRLYDLHAIHGQKIGSARRSYPAIGPRGRRDFWVQLHTRHDFRACDDCPHDENSQGV